MDTAILHMGADDIINSEVNKDLLADSIINTAIQCAAFVVKSVYILRMTVSTETQLGFYQFSKQNSER